METEEEGRGGKKKHGDPPVRRQCTCASARSISVLFARSPRILPTNTLPSQLAIIVTLLMRLFECLCDAVPPLVCYNDVLLMGFFAEQRPVRDAARELGDVCYPEHMASHERSTSAEGRARQEHWSK